MSTPSSTWFAWLRGYWWLVSLPLLAGAAFWLARAGRSDAHMYMTLPVTRGNIEQTVSAMGVLQPLQYVDVGTQVTGQLKALHVDIGDQVRDKQLVAEIDPTLLQAKADASAASLRNARAQLQDREAQLRLARQTALRNGQLLARLATSVETVEQGEAAERQAAAQVEAFRAQIAQAQAQLLSDQANLRYTRIYAPMAGTVVALPARQGQTLVASQAAPTIMRIADLNTMTVWAQTSEADVPKVKLGMAVYFNTLGQPERRWASRVRQIYPTPETLNNVILYDVLFDIANPQQVLKPQMSAQVYFVLAGASDALLVPVAALQAQKPGKSEGKPKGEPSAGAKAYTVRVLRGGKIEQRAVMVGIATRVSAQVLSGLAEGEQVVVGLAASATGRHGAAPLPGAAPAMGGGRP